MSRLDPVVGGRPAFPDGLAFHRPARPPMDRVLRRLGPSYDAGMLTNGRLVRELEEAAAAYLGVDHVVAVASCTAGLMLVTQALAPPGTTVLMPSFTFSATAHAAVWAGGTPRFAECDVRTCQLDLDDAAARLDGVGLVVGTHVFGAPCRPAALEDLASAAQVPVMFDAAHAFGATHDGRRIGGFGAAEVFSLSPTKVLVGGEGGLVATGDAALAERLRIGRDYGNPGDYDTRFAGLNARMSELHAAVALCSLEDLDVHLAIRRTWADGYRKALAGLPGVRLQEVDTRDASTYKDLTVIVDPEAFGCDRDALAAALRTEGVDTRPYFWPPVHRQQAYASPTFRLRDVAYPRHASEPERDSGAPELPATDWLSARVLSLPLWRDMPDDTVDRVADAMTRIHEEVAS